MKTWTSNTLQGHWPVGTAAVVTAEDIDEAIQLLSSGLKERGLEQTITPEQLVLMPTRRKHVRVLCDGNY